MRPPPLAYQISGNTGQGRTATSCRHRCRRTFTPAGKLWQNLSKQPVDNAKDHRPHQQRYGQHGEIVSKSSGHPPTLSASRHGTALAVELLDAGQAAGSVLSSKRLNRKPFADFTRPKTGLPLPEFSGPPRNGDIRDQISPAHRRRCPLRRKWQQRRMSG